MQAREIRGMSSAEINRRLDDAYQETFNLRFQWVTGQLKNSNRLTEVKQDIACRLNPEISAKVAVAQRHRSPGTLTRTVPLDIAGSQPVQGSLPVRGDSRGKG